MSLTEAPTPQQPTPEGSTEYAYQATPFYEDYTSWMAQTSDITARRELRQDVRVEASHLLSTIDAGLANPSDGYLIQPEQVLNGIQVMRDSLHDTATEETST